MFSLLVGTPSKPSGIESFLSELSSTSIKSFIPLVNLSLNSFFNLSYSVLNSLVPTLGLSSLHLLNSVLNSSVKIPLSDAKSSLNILLNACAFLSLDKISFENLSNSVKYLFKGVKIPVSTVPASFNKLVSLVTFTDEGDVLGSLNHSIAAILESTRVP